MEASVHPHRILTQAPQGPDIINGPMIAQPSPSLGLRPPAQQRVPPELQAMLDQEIKASKQGARVK